MKRKVVDWRWEDPDAQASFAEIVGFPDARQTSEELDKIEALVGLRPPACVLDVGCGTGRHAIELARRGYQVVGIDVAARYLAEARAAAERQGLEVEFRLQRGADLDEENVYDFVLAFYHTLGFMSEDAIAHHLGSIRAAIKPSGAFLLVLAGPRLTENVDTAPVKLWTERDGKFILVEKRIQDGSRYERTVVIDPDADLITEFVERQRAFALADVQRHLAVAGFQHVASLRDLEGHPATPSEFGVFLCRQVLPGSRF